MSSNFGSEPKLLFSVDARKTFLLKALLSSRSGDDCCVIRPLVRGLWLNAQLFLLPSFSKQEPNSSVTSCDGAKERQRHD
jgi:hypothetical protein